MGAGEDAEPVLWLLTALPATPEGLGVMAQGIRSAHLLALRLFFPFPVLEQVVANLPAVSQADRRRDQQPSLDSAEPKMRSEGSVSAGANLPCRAR